MTTTWDSGISKAYEDELERGVGTRLDGDVDKALKTVTNLKTWGRGVLPTKQQKQAAGIVALTAGGGYAGKKYQQAKYGDPTIPPALQRARKVVKSDDVSKGAGRVARRAAGKLLPKRITDPGRKTDAIRARMAREDQAWNPTDYRRRLHRMSGSEGFTAQDLSPVGKAQRRIDPEYDRARRRGLLQGAAIGGAIPLGMVGSKTFQTTGAADMAGKPKTWKGKAIAIRSTPTGRFPRGRAAALGGAALLAGGAAVSQRRGTKERNRQWT